MEGELEELLDFKAVMEATNQSQGTHYTVLKQKQEEALKAALTGDLVAVLPTGFGKTVVIHLLPFLQPENPPTSVIVVAPLNAIISEQKARFGASGLVVDDQVLHDLEEGKVSDEIKRLKSGDFLFLLGHPEAITCTALRKVLMEGTLEKKISHVVVDESHCILSWGRSLFREAFLELGCLRITLPDAKMVALTATATPTAIKEIQDALHMRNPVCVKASPDRPSVYLEVKKRPPGSGRYSVADSYSYCTEPILQELKEKEEAFARTIMYMPLNWCGQTHQRALQVLLDSPKHEAIHHTGELEIKSFVAQFHAPQTTEMKSLISNTMLQKNSNLRLLLATEAYGMGADCPDVRHVIHVGPPKNLETYAQEIGRCARDGLPGRATLFYNNADVAMPGKKQTKRKDNGESDESTDESDEEASPANDQTTAKHPMTRIMRKFCKNKKKCRRELLMNYFGFDVVRSGDSECCDVCSGTVETDYTRTSPDPKPNQVLVHMLMQYFDFENEDEAAKGANCVAELHTGLCMSLARKIASYAERYGTGGDLKAHYPYLTDNNIINIQNIIMFHFSD